MFHDVVVLVEGNETVKAPTSFPPQNCFATDWVIKEIDFLNICLNWRLTGFSEK